MVRRTNAKPKKLIVPKRDYSKQIATAYKQGCLKAAEQLQTALNEFDAAYTNGARIAQDLPDGFTAKYLEIVGVKLALRLFIAQCRQPL